MTILDDWFAKMARWEHTLNSWTWPDDMPFKPRDFDSLPYYSRNKHARTKYTVMKWPMFIFHWLIGPKERVRYHQVVTMGKTNAEFEQWWSKYGDLVEV